jgi:lipopolysaccharide/colanic/teichoic acid biosynthesis glycosyltransferase
VSQLLPDKIRLAKEYIEHSSFLFDTKLIFETIVKIFGPSNPKHEIRSTKQI